MNATRVQRIKRGALRLQVVPDCEPLKPYLLISGYSGDFIRGCVDGRKRWIRGYR